MSNRGVVINRSDGSQILLGGEPLLDAAEKVLVVAFKDGSSRTFNWDYVVDFYYFTEQEYRELMEGILYEEVDDDE